MSPGAGGLRRLVDPALFSDPYAANNFIGSVLEASTETSMIGMDLDGNIQLWNEGARRLYGYEPEDVISKANSSILHVAADVEAGLPVRMMATALETGKFEGSVVRRRKDGTTFAARAAYDALSYTHRKEWMRWVEEAKKPETRATRIAKTVAGLREGKKTH